MMAYGVGDVRKKKSKTQNANVNYRGKRECEGEAVRRSEVTGVNGKMNRQGRSC